MEKEFSFELSPATYHGEPAEYYIMIVKCAADGINVSSEWFDFDLTDQILDIYSIDYHDICAVIGRDEHKAAQHLSGCATPAEAAAWLSNPDPKLTKQAVLESIKRADERRVDR